MGRAGCCFFGITRWLSGSNNLLGGENWSTVPSVEDLAFLAISRLLLGVDRDVEELAITVALALQSCSLAVSILKAVSFIERRPRLHNLELSAPQSELKGLQLSRVDSKNVWRLSRILKSKDHGVVSGDGPYD